MTGGQIPDKTGKELSEQRFHLLESIAHDLGGDLAFPTCFDTLIRLREVLRDPNLSLDQVVAAVSLDPLIPLRLVSLANSALYRRGNEVKDLKATINRLGLQLVRSSAMSVAMSQLLNAKDMVVFADTTKKIWKHSVRTACTAHVIAKRLTKVNPDEAFLAGLTHDIGAFYLFYQFSKLDELRGRPVSAKFLVARWHEGIGYEVQKTLGMPDEIALACQDHDALLPEAGEPYTLRDIIYISNKLSGGMAFWLEEHEDIEAERTLIASLTERYKDLQPEIDAFESEMQTLLTGS